MMLLRINVYILCVVGLLVLFGNTAPVFENSNTALSFENCGPLVLDLISIRGAKDSSHGKRADPPVIILEQLQQQQQRFAINVVLGGNSYALHLDTGNSASWIAQSNFQCYDLKNKLQGQRGCGLGPNLGPSLGPNRQPGLDEDGYRPIADFKESYAGGESAAGKLIKETVEIAGFKVTDVRIGLADKLVWRGDGLTVGSFGISGNDSLWQDICKQYRLPLQFTLAVNREDEGKKNGGFLAIGGTPPDGEPLTHKSWETVNLADNAGHPGWFIEGFELQKSKISQKTLIDSGSVFIHLPPQPFEEFLALWDLAPKLHKKHQLWMVDCEVEGPDILDFKIGQAYFKIPVNDYIIQDWQEFCYLTVRPLLQPNDPPVLGLPFMRHVVINHDWAKRKMSFKQRVYT
ncbi:aspartic peptidase domain-containing protein [Massariosphaeria phaeospora]|uniref:Aspartic peptidase domain-containing protein n=1 Tax=Massariosphaeria phaeospora TaxID=100035 RepID=A0A7C8I8F9_9PLEO|nr:aspartic peptidase domain-containing protein [Massariosphaeria phaeospora]